MLHEGHSEVKYVTFLKTVNVVMKNDIATD